MTLDTHPFKRLMDDGCSAKLYLPVKYIVHVLEVHQVTSIMLGL